MPANTPNNLTIEGKLSLLEQLSGQISTDLKGRSSVRAGVGFFIDRLVAYRAENWEALHPGRAALELPNRTESQPPSPWIGGIVLKDEVMYATLEKGPSIVDERDPDYDPAAHNLMARFQATLSASPIADIIEFHPPAGAPKVSDIEAYTAQLKLGIIPIAL